MMEDQPIVLASSSQARTRLLTSAGVRHICDPANLDEAAIKAGWTGRPEALARELARSKALAVSARHPDALVIGADQVLALGSTTIDKPGAVENVRGQLERLSGREHRLISAVAVACGPDVLWDLVDTAHMHMRRLSEGFLDEYIARVGSGVASSAGAYHLENLGAQLFEKVEGDFFTVMGLPLIPLLNFLRARKALKS